jgi:hypothetical protein
MPTLSRESLLKVYDLAQERGSRDLAADVLDFVLRHDDEAGYRVPTFTFGEDYVTAYEPMPGGVCERAITSRDCPWGHKWLPPLVEVGRLPTVYLPFATFDHGRADRAFRDMAQRDETLAFVEASAAV